MLAPHVRERRESESVDFPRRCAVSVFSQAPEGTPRELNVTVSITWDGTYTCIQNAAGQRMHQHAYIVFTCVWHTSTKCNTLPSLVVTIPVSEECCIACVCHDVCTKMRCNKLHGFEYKLEV